MYNEVYQRKFLSILDAVGTNPLLFYRKEVPYGCIKRIMDNDLHSVAIEITSDNPSVTYIRLPDHCHKGLSIFLPIVNILIKNTGQPFTLYMEIIDQERKVRKCKFGNCFKITKRGNTFFSMPITWKYGWNHIVLDLEHIIKTFFGTYYMECKLIEIHANCRLRKIFFSDKEYNNEELPPEYKLQCLNPHNSFSLKKDSGEEFTKNSDQQLDDEMEGEFDEAQPIEFIVGEHSTTQDNDTSISRNENLTTEDSKLSTSKVEEGSLLKEGSKSIRENKLSLSKQGKLSTSQQEQGKSSLSRQAQGNTSISQQGQGKTSVSQQGQESKQSVAQPQQAKLSRKEIKLSSLQNKQGKLSLSNKDGSISKEGNLSLSNKEVKSLKEDKLSIKEEPSTTTKNSGNLDEDEDEIKKKH